MSNDNEEPRVELQTRVYNLRSGARQREHVSPLAGRVSLSPARDDVTRDDVTNTKFHYIIPYFLTNQSVYIGHTHAS